MAPDSDPSKKLDIVDEPAQASQAAASKSAKDAGGAGGAESAGVAGGAEDVLGAAADGATMAEPAVRAERGAEGEQSSAKRRRTHLPPHVQDIVIQRAQVHMAGVVGVPHRNFFFQLLDALRSEGVIPEGDTTTGESLRNIIRNRALDQ